MKFTLLFYTDNWDVGPVVELAQTPTPGSVVWIGDRRCGGDESDMYYVDNVMYPELGMDKEDTVYLYVRPYTGYSDYAPRTELDRVTEKLEKVADELGWVREELSELNMRNSALNEGLSSLASTVEDKQQEISDQLADVVFALETIKDSV